MTCGTASRIGDASADVAIVDGRVSVDIENADAEVTVTGRDRQPLSRTETHATLSVVGEGFRAAARLDAEQAEALRDALDEALTWEGAGEVETDP